MRRKPLFPPPTNPATGKRARNKGRQSRSMLTINGRIEMVRRWWFDREAGSNAPADALCDGRGETITRGTRELVCRLNQKGASFDEVADNLARTAHVKMCGETARQIVEDEGRKVLKEQQAAAIDTAWTAQDCAISAEKTRIYVGCDGVMTPVITAAEKRKRRAQIKEKRRRCGRKCRPLPPMKAGADESWKEMKVVYYYNQDKSRQHVAATMKNHSAAGRLMRREADRLKFRQANERVALVDGAPWIRRRFLASTQIFICPMPCSSRRSPSKLPQRARPERKQLPTTICSPQPNPIWSYCGRIKSVQSPAKSPPMRENLRN